VRTTRLRVTTYVSMILCKMGFWHRLEAAVYATRVKEREQTRITHRTWTTTDGREHGRHVLAATTS